MREGELYYVIPKENADILDASGVALRHGLLENEHFELVDQEQWQSQQAQHIRIPRYVIARGIESRKTLSVELYPIVAKVNNFLTFYVSIVFISLCL